MISYKAEVRNSAGWRSYNAATLGVSVTSPNWQGDKLAAILDFAGSNFEIIRIDVTDALYRHNFMADGLKPNQALAQANALGTLWLTQHQGLIDACRVKPQIIRWAAWYRHPDFQDALAGFHHAHAVNPILREAVNEDVIEFHRRKGSRPSLAEAENARNYLIEEMAVITLQTRELPSVKIYPGEELSCLNVVRRGLIEEAPKGLELEHFAKIKIEKRRYVAPVIETLDDRAIDAKRDAFTINKNTKLSAG